MIPDNRPESQSVPTPEPCCICPHCGHVHGGYDQQASTLLDCLTVATEAIAEAKRLVETEVLP